MVHPETETFGDFSGRWWVGHTKSRAEKAFAWDLRRMQISYFLPMVDRVRMYGGRKRRVLLPLFPSYVFLCGTEEDRYRAMTTGHLCQTLDIANQDSLIVELEHLRSALVKKAELDFYPFTAVGRICRVCAGPFRGLEGIVVRRDGKCRLVLEVSILGQGASLEIDADFLEPC